MIKKMNYKIMAMSLVIVMLLGCMFMLNPQTIKAEDLDFNSKIQTLVDSIQEKDWESYTGLMSTQEQGFYDYYFSDDSYTDGIKQINAIQLNHIYTVTKEQASSELLTEEYPILSETTDVKTFLVELKCSVDVENAYFYNGINYYLLVFAKESDGAYRVAQFNKPSYKLLDEIISPTLETSDNDNLEKEAALNAAEYAEEGLLVNLDGEFITDGYTLIKENILTNEITDVTVINENAASTMENNYPDHPQIDEYKYRLIPSKISVRLDSGEVVTPSLAKYIKNTLPNEWYASWDKYALRAGAYCVKGVGVYRSIKPINTSYMVTTTTQKYKPNSAVSETDSASNYVSNRIMVSSSNRFFFPEYGAGTQGSAGTRGTGRLLQWGTQYLATQKSYTAKQILNYYYKGSDCSSGELIFITH